MSEIEGTAPAASLSGRADASPRARKLQYPPRSVVVRNPKADAAIPPILFWRLPPFDMFSQ